MKKSFCVLALVVAFAVIAAADTIPTTNTGMNLLGSRDLSFLVSGVQANANPVTPSGSAYLVAPPLGYGWVANGGGSNWIAPSTNTGSQGSPAGYYTYQTTFNLNVGPDVFDPSTGTLTGKAWADDGLIAIYLNGNELYIGQTGAGQYAWGEVDYSFTSGFVAGLNTLQFVVYNTPYSGVNPTGLNAQYDVVAYQTPEPGSILLFGTGLVSLAGVLRRKLSK
ncbi:MAG: PEP-CTERM sorting domain-containing protein [Acidobacteriia bacterium]|nr:PEP-CTERM sorting domain-containing protein [Terriglobia bacterium]